jgi:hypothetical protein
VVRIQPLDHIPSPHHTSFITTTTMTHQLTDTIIYRPPPSTPTSSLPLVHSPLLLAVCATAICIHNASQRLLCVCLCSYVYADL